MLASYGHVRDLPSRSAAVRPDDGFAVRWARLPGADARLAALADAVQRAAALVLATDPDREGEAIAWHVTQELQARPKIPRKPFHISPVPHARRGAPGAGHRPRPRGRGHHVARHAGAAGVP